MTGSVLTFGRRRRADDAASSESSLSTACYTAAGEPSATSGSAVTSATSSSYMTAPSVLTPVPESPAEQDENAPSVAKAPAGRFRRKGAAERQQADRQRYIMEMRAHFEEVDAFELAVETPPGPQRPAAAGQERRSPLASKAQPQEAAAETAAAAPPPSAARHRAMSLGLSRRRSSMAPWAARASLLASSSQANPSPLKLRFPAGSQAEEAADMRAARRSTLVQQPGAHRLSVAADNAGGVLGSPGRPSLGPSRRSSVVPSRQSSVLSRLSLGLNDALQWLGVKGKIPTAAAAGEGHHAADGGTAAVPERPALSPIASPGVDAEQSSSPAEPSPQPSAADVQAAEQQPAAVESAAGSASPGPAAEGEQAGLRDALDDSSEAAEQQQADDDAAQQQAADAQEEEDAADALGDQLAAALRLDDAEQQVAEQSEVQLAAAGEAAAAEQAAAAEEAELTPLQQLLVLCGQETDVERLPSMDELLGRHVDLKKVRKIGEGTFGEAFKAGSVVLKLVPMEGSVLVNGEPQKRADEILAEVSVTLTLSRLNGADAEPGTTPDNLTTGFVETFGVGVCRGAYSEALRREWHRWDKENGSENEEVDIFGGDQLFVVFVVADGGVDLEHIQLRTFEEVRSVLLQTALALAVAEEACAFEHRDLHWGNLLIRRSEEGAAGAVVRARLRGVELEAATAGVAVCIIDFTLSRLITVTGEVAFCDLAADPELFKGPKGNVQADTYRRMKKAVRNEWSKHEPATNVFWMLYLVEICMTEKKGWPCTREDLAGLRAFKRRLLNYPSAGELLFDEFLRGGGLLVGGAE